MRHKKGQMWPYIIAAVLMLVALYLAYRMIFQSKGAAEELERLLVFMWPGTLIRQIQQRWRARKKVS